MLARIYLARLDETAWSRSGQHTGLTDLPLTAQDERLAGMEFNLVLTSLLERARRTLRGQDAEDIRRERQGLGDLP